MKMAGNYVQRTIGDECLLLPKDDSITRKAIMLNRSAFTILKMIEEDYSITEIENHYSEIYRIPIELGKRDVSDTISVLMDNKVVENEG